MRISPVPCHGQHTAFACLAAPGSVPSTVRSIHLAPENALSLRPEIRRTDLAIGHMVLTWQRDLKAQEFTKHGGHAQLGSVIVLEEAR